MGTALQELGNKFQQLVAEKQAMVEKYDAEIKEINEAINVLNGKMLKESEVGLRYDDEDPNYIKNNEDGL